MTYELVSFELCPYVQRARLIMLSREIAHSVTYIDLVDPPPWFFDSSPLGQVPLLRMGDDDALFESLAICEFLNEVHDCAIWSEDPRQRAEERAIVGVSNACLSDLNQALSSNERPGFARAREALEDKWDWLDTVLDERSGPLFGGDRISMPDAAFAAIALQLGVVNDKLQLLDEDDAANVASWFEALRNDAVVQQSVVENYADLLMQSVLRRQSHAASVLNS